MNEKLKFLDDVIQGYNEDILQLLAEIDELQHHKRQAEMEFEEILHNHFSDKELLKG